ncbi:hypothetical protein ANCCEY_05773 [Ancylostoma ceylanicum]|uniref:Uncharacterized protein n=1 Tax=Ancylostoma ceylanicum TaxID=53326 RepID=A0A0D6M5G1_9BILA|nr:hypothetical protein ANCCEY_05773 [Ancylostoma ceylanicum]
MTHKNKLENQREYSNTGQQNTEDLVGVRSDGNASYMGRNHHGSGQVVQMTAQVKEQDRYHAKSKIK